MKNNHKGHFSNKGFSPVELIVVIAVMAILAAIAIPTFAHFINTASMASDIDFMNQLERAIIYAFATQDDNVELIEIEVVVNTYDKRIVQINYVLKSEVGKEKQYSIDPKSDPDMLSTLPIDWNYEFKSLSSIDENGKLAHNNWKSNWSITQVTINPWDEIPE